MFSDITTLYWTCNAADESDESAESVQEQEQGLGVDAGRPEGAAAALPAAGAAELWRRRRFGRRQGAPRDGPVPHDPRHQRAAARRPDARGGHAARGAHGHRPPSRAQKDPQERRQGACASFFSRRRYQPIHSGRAETIVYDPAIDIQNELWMVKDDQGTWFFLTSSSTSFKKGIL